MRTISLGQHYVWIPSTISKRAVVAGVLDLKHTLNAAKRGANSIELCIDDRENPDPRRAISASSHRASVSQTQVKRELDSP